jgi:hypothetical protein
MFKVGSSKQVAPQNARWLVVSAGLALLSAGWPEAGGAYGANSAALPSVNSLAANERALVPSSDVSRQGITGTYADVADGTEFLVNDQTAVTAMPGNTTAMHKVGFSGAPSGNVTRVQVYYAASAHSVDGTIQATLYDGDELLADGNLNMLDKHGCGENKAICGYFDDFTGLTASSANNLRVEMRMTNEQGVAGSLSYSQMWIHVTLDLNMRWSATVFKGGGATNGFALSPSNDTVVTAGADGIFRSADLGLYYEPRNKHGVLGPNRRAATVAYHPQKPGILYAGTGGGTTGGAVLRSTDDGLNWSILSTVPIFNSAENNISGIPPGPRSVGNLIGIYGPPGSTDTIWVGTLGFNGQGVMRSTNGGSTWTTIGLAGKFPRSLVLDPTNPDVLYVSPYNDGVHVSTNARAATPTFTKMAGSPANVEELHFVGSTLYAAASTAGVFKLVDGTWVAINNGVPFEGGASWLAITGVRVGSTDVLLAGCTPCAPGNGMYHSLVRSLNGGESWESVTHPNQIDLNVLGSGERWILADVVPWDMLGQSDFFTGGLAAEASPDGDPLKTTFFASSNTGIFRSIDGGSTWHVSVNGLSNAPSALGPNVDPQDTRRAFFGAGHYGMVMSTNHFSTARIDLLTEGTILEPFARSGNPVAFFTTFDTSVTPSKVYVAAGDNQVDIGEVLTKDDVFQPGPWQSLGLNAQFPNKKPAAIVVGRDPNGERVLMVTLHPTGGIARKVGDGLWSLVPDPRLNTTTIPWNGRGASHTHPHMTWVPGTQLVYFWDMSKGLFRSNDGGLTWTLVSNLTTNAVRTGGMAVHPTNPSTIYLAAFNGLYRISNAELGSVLDGTAVQEKIGNFPFANNVWVDKYGRLFVNSESNPQTPARMEVSWNPLDASPTFESLTNDYYSNFSLTPDGMAVGDDGTVYLPHRQQGFMIGLPE